MGMSIEDIIQGLKETNMICNSVFAYDRKKYIDGAIDKLCKYQMMQTDYEARLKADLKAILVELQLEIKEHDPGCGWEGYADKNVIDCIIQEKINALEEDTP